MNSNVRVRFAPSPTGALHIGGVRTALYNYLFAKHTGGKFILRIEDTDRTRFVEGAEEYIINALKWLDLKPDEGVSFGGNHGPYRQSDRKELYGKYADELIASGNAYYAFDTAEELDALREARKEAGEPDFKYNFEVRDQLNNSLALSKEEVEQRMRDNVPFTIRLKVPKDEIITFSDLVRGEVQFNSKELDDKILLKSDGMPSYHMANIVDDHLMEISHVVRGEEWLSSTPTHVLLYRAFGWESTMPKFVHLPLLLKPTGKGKLSKRDGAKLGIPVFPMDWFDKKENELFPGFKEAGYLKEALTNFLALLGWSAKDNQEILSLEDLIEQFDFDRVQKSGARFDIDKAKWFNQQYILAMENSELIKRLKPLFDEKGYTVDDEFMNAYCELYKERAELLPEFVEKGYYFFEDVKAFDEKNLKKKVLKKWNSERRTAFEGLLATLNSLADYNATTIKAAVEAFIAEKEWGFGDVLPVLRLAATGTLSGPPVFDVLALLGKTKVASRMEFFFDLCDKSIIA